MFINNKLKTTIMVNWKPFIVISGISKLCLLHCNGRDQLRPNKQNSRFFSLRWVLPSFYIQGALLVSPWKQPKTCDGHGVWEVSGRESEDALKLNDEEGRHVVVGTT